ncbi:hypothetical protein [Streptacidiphilus melanogenes]|uniref:hypothetical protein n=1 Tax=Streptacidiphilus melanogenes TaxID=411235 RepID=UPI000694FAC2|nr:hypothetical protein [Streptacidiphilus melanogenes]
MTAMAGDAYRAAKQAIVSVWHRFIPFGAEALDGELEQAHSQLVAAQAAGNPETERDLAARWQQALQPLFAADPGAVEALWAALVDAGVLMPPAAPSQAQTGDRRLVAKADGHARVYQAGNDLHVSER